MINYENTANEIITTLCSNGFQAYLTGGAVRDLFRGTEPDDFDIVTNASPDQIKNIFPKRKVKSVGNNFLVTIVDNIEVATYRSDLNVSPGRSNCIVKKCHTIQEDLERRDFTFNSLAICPYSGEVIDPFNGRNDLIKKVVRFVGDPKQRIEEDYLRMIRAARFACLIEGSIDNKSLNSIRESKNLVKNISTERIRLELLKVLKYRKPSIFFNILYESELLEILFPEIYETYGVNGGKYHDETIFEHLMLVGDYITKNDPILRLSGYLHDIGKVPVYNHEDDSFIDHEKIGYDMVQELLKKYKFTNDEINKISSLTLLHMRSFKDLTPKATRRLIKKIDEKGISWKDWILLKIADKKGNLKSENYTKEEIKNTCLKIHNAFHESKSGGFKITDLAINGNDVMEKLNITPGPQVGNILKGLLEKVLDDPTINNRETLMNLL